MGQEDGPERTLADAGGRVKRLSVAEGKDTLSRAQGSARKAARRGGAMEGGGQVRALARSLASEAKPAAGRPAGTYAASYPQPPCVLNIC